MEGCVLPLSYAGSDAHKQTSVFLLLFAGLHVKSRNRFWSSNPHERSVRKAEQRRGQRFVYPRRQHDRTWIVIPDVLEMMQLPLIRSEKGADKDMVFLSAFFGPLTRHDSLSERFGKHLLAEGGANLIQSFSVLFGSTIYVFNSHVHCPTVFQKRLAR